MCQIAGGSVGLGLTTAIVTEVAEDKVSGSAIADQLSHNQEIAVNKVLAGTETGQQLLDQFPQAAGRLMDLAQGGTRRGHFRRLLVVGVLAFGGFLVGTFFVGGRLHRKRHGDAAKVDGLVS